MVKIIITGGDNCFCCACGGVCDRLVMEEDTKAKTLKYIDGRGLCLGQYCTRCYTCEDGTELRRDGSKWRAYRNGEELPCAVRGSKWGKDCEYRGRGVATCASTEEWKSGRVALLDWKSAEEEREYWAQYENYNELQQSGKWRGMEEFMRPTGWTLITEHEI